MLVLNVFCNNSTLWGLDTRVVDSVYGIMNEHADGPSWPTEAELLYGTSSWNHHIVEFHNCCSCYECMCHRYEMAERLGWWQGELSIVMQHAAYLVSESSSDVVTKLGLQVCLCANILAMLWHCNSCIRERAAG